MKKTMFITLMLTCCSILVCLAVAADLNGKWTGAVKTPNGDFPLSYTFTVDGGKLTGTAEAQNTSTAISDGKINGTDFSFNLDFNGTSLKNTGKYYGDSITVEVDYQGTMLHGLLKRDADKK
jgi:hypothetical protein